MTVEQMIDMLITAMYNDEVVITSGNYIDAHKEEMYGHIHDIRKELAARPEIRDASVDPDGARLTMRKGFPCMEIFVG